MHDAIGAEPGTWSHRWSLRLLLTVWMVYALFTTTNVVRETYLSLALVERGSLRVDEYLGLHPDLFEMPGRGAYINNNPGASLLGAIGYLAVRPVIQLAVRLRPEIALPKPPATYDDPRPNRTRFMNAARARGLDITLVMAAVGMQVLVMASTGGLAAVLMFGALRRRLGRPHEALWWALCYAFATPLLFRSAFLNQNALISHCVLGAWLLCYGDEGVVAAAAAARWWRCVLMGVLLGFALLCDYGAAPLVLVFGLMAMHDGWRRGGIIAGTRQAAWFTVGAAPMIAVLLGYQWAAFGSPWYPAQHYMPPTEYSVLGWNGVTLPTASLLWGNLFDLRYGLFAFCPLLLAAGAAVLPRFRGELPRAEAAWTLAAFLALYLFSSANQFANLQWNTGVRYLVPIVPLLFLSSVPVLRALPRPAAVTLVAMSALTSLAISMMREDVGTSLRLLLARGPTLPLLVVLRKTASGYRELQLPAGATWMGGGVLVMLLWLLWRDGRRSVVAPNGQ